MARGFDAGRGRGEVMNTLAVCISFRVLSRSSVWEQLRGARNWRLRPSREAMQADAVLVCAELSRMFWRIEGDRGASVDGDLVHL